MATSNKVEFMQAFGNVHKEMMDWMIANKPELASYWIEKLSSIKWKNYLTKKEAETIVSNMDPKAPWSYEQWSGAMEKAELPLCEEPYYNSYALFVTMNMKMSDSGHTLKKYISDEDLLKAVYELAVDSLKDRDGMFSIRKYFGV